MPTRARRLRTTRPGALPTPPPLPGESLQTWRARLGGQAAAKKLGPAKRKARARKAAKKRWKLERLKGRVGQALENQIEREKQRLRRLGFPESALADE